jgi:hypothetical protein
MLGGEKKEEEEGNYYYHRPCETSSFLALQPIVAAGAIVDI